MQATKQKEQIKRKEAHDLDTLSSSSSSDEEPEGLSYEKQIQLKCEHNHPLKQKKLCCDQTCPYLLFVAVLISGEMCDKTQVIAIAMSPNYGFYAIIVGGSIAIVVS